MWQTDIGQEDDTKGWADIRKQGGPNWFGKVGESVISLQEREDITGKENMQMIPEFVWTVWQG